VTPQAAGPRPVTQVAVGVLVRDDGAVLLADRPAGKPYAGYWEFPGGKIEGGESIAQALARELAEELGVAVQESLPWVTMDYDYPHAYVRLHFRRIYAWTGAPRPVEGQRLQFLSPGKEPPAPLLPAAVPAMRWIQLPTVTGCSQQTATRAEEAVQWLENVLGRGLRQVIWHEPRLDDAQRMVALAACGRLAAAYGARLLVDVRSLPVDGGMPPDLTGRLLDVAALRTGSHRRTGGWLGTMVETAADLASAAALGCDFAILDAARVRPGTPQWGPLAELCGMAPLPLYLAGELDLAYLVATQAVGAHGLVTRPSLA